MPETEDSKSKSLTQELYTHTTQSSSKWMVLTIIMSLIFGIVGGAFGGIYALKNDNLRKYFNLNFGQVAPISQSITLSEDSAVIDVVKKASPAVVSIVITKDLNKIPGYGTNPYEFDPFFPFFGLPNSQQPKSSEPNLQQVGAGSGFFVSADGLILTNKHVVSDSEASYTVITSDGKHFEAKVMAVDPRNDLAVVKVEADKLPFLKLADSSLIQVGQRAVAIGNSLGEYQNTVTTGIVSGIGRQITASGNLGEEQLDCVIQTDAAINPGNSGGPLLNTAAEVIGINTAIDRQGQLVGFAIPSNDAQKALDSYRKTGKIIRPFIGVRYIMINKALADKEKLPKDYGALLVRGDTATDFAVVPGSPADKAGLVENDIILEVEGKKLEGDMTLARALRDKDVGQTVSMRVYSPSTSLGTGKGEDKIVRVTLGEAK